MRDGLSKVLEDKSASIFYSVRFNPDGRYIAAGNGDGMLRIWNVRTSQLVMKWAAHGGVIRSVVFTLDGKGLVSSSGHRSWKYWDISLLELSELMKDSMAGHKSKVTAHTVRHSHVPVQLFILTQVYTPFILLFCLQDDVSSIAISADSQWVVSGSGDHSVRIWDLHNAALQCTLRGHKARVWSVASCPTGNYLASGSRNGWVALWRYEAA